MNRPSADQERPLTVLVVDDSATWRRLVKSILENELEISTVVASSGQEGLDILESTPVDVVVSDLNMPGMNGLQFLQRARPVSPRTKVVIMTADLVSRTMVEECIARGAFGVISKEEIDPNLLRLLRYLKESD